MKENMKQRFRVYRRQGGVFYLFDRQTGKRESLETDDEYTALRLLHAKNEAQQQPIINRQIARAYLAAGDPEIAKRTWQTAMDEIVKTKTDDTRHRWETAIKDKAFDWIRNRVILETHADLFLRVLEEGTVATNVFLRRLHNFALDVNWLPWPVVPKRQWPAVRYSDKRAITLKEHEAIVAREGNPERKAFYRLAWHFGASQTDIALLDAKNIDWDDLVISFARKKTGSIAIMRFDEEMAEVLRSLPGCGPLFPYLRRVRAGDSATEFKQRCLGLGIRGVSLHSYRYAWAERAKVLGYPDGLRRRRWATIAKRCIGHMREMPR